uniref:Mediator of RNA polymerase II transcription subunit 31 n=1 Tax=Arcella intermedia TaxID=1963864 RepID=A0A6B2LR96_9EUKA
MDLEFVQALANPEYLKFLAHEKNYMEEKEFIDYLKYLTYWHKPEYTRFIMYPHCLHILELLQNEDFRKALKHPVFIEMISNQQFYHWKHYVKRRNTNAINKK